MKSQQLTEEVTTTACKPSGETRGWFSKAAPAMAVGTLAILALCLMRRR